jgi:hypothetical protein
MAEPPSVLTAVAAAGFGPPMVVDHLKKRLLSLGAADNNIVLGMYVSYTVMCDSFLRNKMVFSDNSSCWMISRLAHEVNSISREAKSKRN